MYICYRCMYAACVFEESGAQRTDAADDPARTGEESPSGVLCSVARWPVWKDGLESRSRRVSRFASVTIAAGPRARDGYLCVRGIQ